MLIDFSTNDINLLKEQVDVARGLLNECYLSKVSVEIKKVKGMRTLKQNSYLHVILTYFAIETGNSLDYVKRNYFKRLCNADLFYVEKEDKYLGIVDEYRSSSDLNVDEMTLAINRFRNWASIEGGIYLPSPNEGDKINYIRLQIKKNEEFIY